MNDQRSPIGIALAPAKINLGLHVLGRRPDGFHDIDTVMQAITLFDRIAIYPAGNGTVSSDVPNLEGEDNLITKAARALAQRCGKEIDVDFRLHKRIPIAAGLGGGSSNAATTLRLLARHWNIDADDPVIHDSAVATGSDVPFFLQGGSARATGRGEMLEPLSRRETTWFVLLVPPIAIEGKTAQLYGALTARDFSSPIGSDLTLHNAFERPLYDNFPSVRVMAAAFASLTAAPVGLSGAGPAHFAAMPDLRSAAALLFSARQDARLQHCRLYLARTMSGAGPMSMLRNEDEA